jgi:hypothetical protein
MARATVFIRPDTGDSDVFFHVSEIPPGTNVERGLVNLFFDLMRTVAPPLFIEAGARDISNS